MENPSSPWVILGSTDGDIAASTLRIIDSATNLTRAKTVGELGALSVCVCSGIAP